MMELATGNLLDAPVEAVVNTVNTVGVMGKGLALQFKRRFAWNFAIYEAACKRGELEVGRMLVVPVDGVEGRVPRFIINFPTKKHWRSPSDLAYIRSGLPALVAEVRDRAIRSIAIPPLGCGNGGLRWRDVEPLIREAFAALPDVRVLLFPPADIKPVLAPRPDLALNRLRALLIKLIESYRQLDYALTKIEVQKLTYFLQEAGEDFHLQYTKQAYGPYAAALRHVLVAMEGSFLQGVGDQTQRAEIRLMPGAAEAADRVLASEHESRQRLERVSQLIEGFETPYGMELLATVHWVVHREQATPDTVVDAVQGWNDRKRDRYQPRHILRAWQRLDSQHWL